MTAERAGSRVERAVARARGIAGFTLLELLAVLLILSLLVAVLVTTLGSAEEVVQEKLTGTRLAQIASVLTEYEIDQGDWPPSAFTAEQGEAPNGTNVGAECLVLALWAGGRDGAGLDEDWLGNVDGDYAKKKLDGTFPDRGLRELLDTWGNPIAYLHHADYGRSDLYLTLDPLTGEKVESVVEARKNPATGDFADRRRYQLISAGADGRFGTEDDVVH